MARVMQVFAPTPTLDIRAKRYLWIYCSHGHVYKGPMNIRIWLPTIVFSRTCVGLEHHRLYVAFMTGRLSKRSFKAFTSLLEWGLGFVNSCTYVCWLRGWQGNYIQMNADEWAREGTNWSLMIRFDWNCQSITVRRKPHIYRRDISLSRSNERETPRQEPITRN
jgi:hypothetical protein